MSNVIICPEPHFQFLDMAGRPLSGGFIFTYDAGTSNLRNTFTDSTGLVQNANPIPLDATGSPSNGSSQTGIWIENRSYKFVAYNSAMVQQWSTDNISGYFGLLNMSNVWTFGQTFSAAITDTLVDNQIITGAPGNQTTLDFPPPVGNITLHFPNTAGTVITGSSPTISTPTITGGVFNTPSLNVLKNTTVTTQTGDTSLHTIYTIALPGGAMGLNNQLRITLVFGANVIGAGGVTILINYGGTRISAASVVPAAMTNTNGLYLAVVGGNVGATNTQVWDELNLSAHSGATGSNLAHTTSTVDSTVSQNITVTYQGGAGTDSVTFYRCLVEIL